MGNRSNALAGAGRRTGRSADTAEVGLRTRERDRRIGVDSIENLLKPPRESAVIKGGQ